MLHRQFRSSRRRHSAQDNSVYQAQPRDVLTCGRSIGQENEREARGDVLAQTEPPSVLTGVGETLTLKTKTARAVGTQKAKDSKPKGDYKVFRPLRRANGISPPTSFGELSKAEQKISNLDGESRNDHRNVLIVQDGYSYWLQSCHTQIVSGLTTERLIITTTSLHRQITDKLGFGHTKNKVPKNVASQKISQYRSSALTIKTNTWKGKHPRACRYEFVLGDVPL